MTLIKIAHQYLAVVITKSMSIKQNYKRVLLILMISFMILYSFSVRLNIANRGLPYLHYWDEPQLSSTALKMLKTGDLNPHFFNYGSLPIYMMLSVDIIHYYYLMTLKENAVDSINSLNDIRTNEDGNYYWTISHPSFYLWNRVLMAIIGTFIVFLTFCLGRFLVNDITGLLAGFLLAANAVHIDNSGWIIPDPISSFFFFSCIFSSLIFLRNSRLFFLILSLICGACASASKYNAIICLVSPFVILLWKTIKNESKPLYWLIFFMVPSLAFVIVMPFAVIDFTTFISQSGYELRHYSVLGHPGASISPGWPHIKQQLLDIIGAFSPVVSIIALLGFIAIFIARIRFFVFMPVIVYFLLLSRSIISFPRNLLILYPFIALLFSLGLHQLWLLIKHKVRKPIVTPVCIIVSFLIIVPRMIGSYKRSLDIKNSKETRSLAIIEADALARKKTIPKIFIASELRIHGNDLRRIRVPYEIISGEDVLLKIKIPFDNILCILPSHLNTLDRSGLPPKMPYMKNSDIEYLSKWYYVKLVGDICSSTFIDAPSTNPGILIIAGKVDKSGEGPNSAFTVSQDAMGFISQFYPLGPRARLKAGELKEWQKVQGFAEWIEAPPHRGAYRSYLGDVMSGWAYSQEGRELSWRTQPIPKEGATAISWIGGTCYIPGKSELWCNGRKLLAFNLANARDQAWAEGGVELWYIHGGDTRSETTPYGLSGLFVLLLPADLVVPGKPLNLTVKLLGDPGAWYMIHEYADAIAASGLIP